MTDGRRDDLRAGRADTPLLAMTGIEKAFDGVPALREASLEIARGEVHALIGQNGAGKSTLIKILTGIYRRDAGEVRLDGADGTLASPRAAQAAGIATIYQELNLVPLRSVTENIVLGHAPRRFGMFIDWAEAHRTARRVLARFGIDIDVTAALGSYPTAIQQLVAIARAVSLDARLVIMDEPTSSLDATEAEVLFGVVRGLRDAGVSVLYVTHFLDELPRIADRVTIMRDGRTASTEAVAGTTKLGLIAAMLGRDPEDIAAAGMTDLKGGSGPRGEVLLAADGIAAGPRLRHVDLAVHAGEIVGLGGLLGAGRTETARAIFGVDALTAGSVTLRGAAAEGGPAAAIRAGMGYLTEDRKAEGIVPDMSVRENLTLALLPRLARGGRIDRAREAALVREFVEALGIRLASMDQPIRTLSGGNQQKVLIARWLATEPSVLILDEPTRGVDVGAKREIQGIIRAYVDRGFGALLISSEFEELVEGADRIVVLHEGRSTGELVNPGITEDALLGALAASA